MDVEKGTRQLKGLIEDLRKFIDFWRRRHIGVQRQPMAFQLADAGGPNLGLIHWAGRGANSNGQAAQQKQHRGGQTGL